MNPLNSMNSIEALVFIACQPVNGYGMCYIHEKETKAKSAAGEKSEKDRFFALVEDATKSNRLEDQGIVNAALACMQNRVSKMPKPNRIISLIQDIYCYILGKKKELSIYEEISNSLLDLQSKNKAYHSEPQIHLEALCAFMSTFEDRFGVKPPPMKGGEIFKFFEVSERIWESERVQNLPEMKQKVDEFNKLMEELIIGSHFLFVAIPNKVKNLFNKITSEHIPKFATSAPYSKNSAYKIVGSMFEKDIFSRSYLVYDPTTKRTRIVDNKPVQSQSEEELKEGHATKLLTWTQYEASGVIYHIALKVIQEVALAFHLITEERSQYSGYTLKTRSWLSSHGTDYNHPFIITPATKQKPGKKQKANRVIWDVSANYKAMPPIVR